MTPEQLNAVMVSVHARLDEEVLPTMAASYERVLRSQGRIIARRLRERAQSLTAAFVPPDEDEVIDADKLSEKITRQNEKERRAAAEAIRDALAAHDIAWDIHGNFTPDALAAVGARATFAVDQELREIYRTTITQAFEEGWSIPRTASSIVSNVDGVAAYRATALARTDLIGLANGASQDAAVDAFAEREDVTKIWLATGDDRTRDTHVEADGQEVPLNQPFDVGGAPLMYPGDPDGPDEEVIQCRCTLIYGSVEAEAAAAEEGLPEEGEAAFSPLWNWVRTGSFRPSDYSLASMPKEDSMTITTQPNTMAASTITITVNDEEAPVEVAARVPWDGVLAIAGKATSDRRYLIPGEIGHRDLPRPFRAVFEEQGGHENARSVGSIDNIEFIPASEFDKFDLGDLPDSAVVIYGTGTLDGSEWAEEAKRIIENGAGISIDLPWDRLALFDPETFEEIEWDQADPGDVMAGKYLQGMGGKIAAATIVDVPAFEQTTVRLTETDAIVASAFHAHVGDRDWPLRVAEIAAAIPAEMLVASAAPIAPPRDWFFVEEPDEPTPLTILPNGQVYGHLALWNTCHVGRSNGAFSSCMYAPHSPSGYKQFHLGAMLCEDGMEVAIGRLTVDTGHAALHLGAAAARRHYDNTGTCVGFVRAVDGIFGIWLSGVVRSDATEEQIRDLRACPPSGDWRSVDHALELQAALAVNVAGFPVPRSQLALAASGETLEVATLILGAPEEEDFAESLRAEYALTDEENVALLFDLDDPAPAA